MNRWFNCERLKDYGPEIFGVLIFFFIATCFLTNWVILNINSQLFTSGVGDATSGFLWLLYADKDWSYFHSNTTLVNFPYGESLWSPVYVTWTLIMGPLWLLSKFMSPIAAMNVMMFVGFMSGGIAGYYLIKRLTKNWLIGLMGGYAIAFVSYHIMKGVDHFTNIFAWVFVAIIASFIAFWRRPTWLRGVLLATSIAAACYTDGYYVFVAGILVAALLVSFVATDLLTRQSMRAISRRVAKVILVGGMSLILMAPILITLLTSQSQITSDLSNSRDDIKKEIAYYASKPIDFLLPVSKNVTVSQFGWYQDLLTQKNSRSNDGENSTYIGYVVLGLYSLGVYYAYKTVRLHARTRKELGLQDFSLVVMVLSVPFMLVWMIQPEIHIAGMKLYTPTEILVRYVPYWRVPARLFVALHPVFVIAACLALTRLVRGWSREKMYILVAVLFGVMALEYYTSIKRPSFGLENMPKTYSWIAQQSDIRAIAELPLVDRPIEIAGYAVFAQLIHGKPIVNSALAKGSPGLFNPLATADNIETINLLRDRGVDTVVLHVRTCDSVEWGTLVHAEYDTYAPAYIDPQAKAVCVYRLKVEQSADSYYVYARNGFESVNAVDVSGNFMLRLKENVATLSVVDQRGRKHAESSEVTVSGTIQAPGAYAWRIEQAGKVLTAGDGLGRGTFAAEVNTASPIRITILPGGAGVTLDNLQAF